MNHSTRVKNVHLGLVPPGPPQHVSLVKGDYEYWHYCCDGTDDRGWGCGYRTLQTICSWVRLQQNLSLVCPVPHEQSISSIPDTTSLKNSATCDISHGIPNKGLDIGHDISITGSGETTCQFASSVVEDANITVVTSGTVEKTEPCRAPLSSLASKHGGGGDDYSSCEIVVLSSGDVSSSLNSGTSKYASAADQDVCDKTWDCSDTRFISSGNESKEPGPPRLSSGKTVGRSDNPQAESPVVGDVPSLLEIQKALVCLGDKPAHFVGSRQWIGSYELCLCLDYSYDVPCKIVHISRGVELKQHLSTLYTHFSTLGSPVMMGGDSDASSKGVVGVCLEPEALLVVDPHHSGKARSVAHLQNAGWVKWILVEEFHQTSFYNVCLPQLAART